VGVGKTIEAGMIARELLDRGIAKRLAVLTPAHLCDQWERELREKFAIETVLVQPSQMARLERERLRKFTTKVRQINERSIDQMPGLRGLPLRNYACPGATEGQWPRCAPASERGTRGVLLCLRAAACCACARAALC
jgi:hypothetical protein